MNQTKTSNKTEKTFRALWWSGVVDGFIAFPVLCIVIGYLAVTAGCLPLAGRWFVQTNELHKAEAIVVLSGGGTERLCYGIELYNRGLASELWHTGDKPVETRSDLMDSEMVLALAARRGVPKEKIRFLPSTSTFEDGQSIVELVKGKKIKSVIIVTSWYHTRRAMNVIHHYLADTNVAVYVSSSTNLPYTPDNWWRDEEGLVNVVDETIKTVLYGWRYGIAP